MNRLPVTDDMIETFLKKLNSHTKADIPPTIVQLITKAYVAEEYQKNEYFCRQDGPANKTGLLLTGSAKATSHNNKREEQVIKFFTPIDFVSPDNPQGNDKSDRDIIFTETSTVFAIYELEQNIVEVQQQFPEIINIMLSMYMKEIESVRKISHMRSINEAKERITYYYQHFGHFDRYFSGTDIASFIGVQRETFSRNKYEALKRY